MLDCFNNFIGINNVCTEQTPTSKLYLNQLTGMSIKIAEKAMAKEHSSVIDFLNEKIDFAIAETIDEVRQNAYPAMQVKSILDNNTVGFWKDNLKPIAAESGRYKGLRIKLDEYPYLVFNLSTISLQLDAAVTTSIKIFDLISGEQVGDDIPITTVANKPTQVVVNLQFPVKKQKLHLFVGYDAGVAGTFKTLIGNARNDCLSCGQGDENNYVFDQYISFHGSSIGINDPKIQSNFKGISGSGGMSLDFSLSCSLDEWICNSANLFARAMLFRAGAEIMLAAKENMDRLNSIMTVNKSSVQFWYSYYLERYMEILHGKRVGKNNDSNVRDKSGILQNLQFPDDICFKCSESSQIVTMLP